MINPSEIFAHTGGNFAGIIMIITAFAAGMISSLSPCSLGMLPLIIGYVGGYSKSDNKTLFLQMLSFSFGMSLVLSIIGVICALTGKAFVGFATPVVMLIFASFVLCLGLNLIGVLDFQLPSIIKKMPENKTGSKFLFPFIVGSTFALAASPCSSPVLAAILALAAVSSNILFSVILLFSFAIGQCVIIIFFALFASALKNAGKFAKYGEILIKFSGIILICVAIYIFITVFKNV